jgi:two-component system nitrate/nitrite sensor histidine kinase NarX
VLKMSIVMIAASQMATEIMRSVEQPRVGDCGLRLSYVNRLRNALGRYPIYFRTAVFTTSAAFAALLIFTSSFFLADFSAAVGKAVGKIHELQLSLASESRAGLSLNDRDEARDLSFLDDPVIVRHSGVDLALLKDSDAVKSPQEAGDAIALLQQAGENLNRAQDAKRIQVTFLQLLSFGLLLFCLARLSINSRRVLIDGVDRIAGSVSSGDERPSAFSGRDEMVRLEEGVGNVLTQIANASAFAEPRASLERMARIQDYLSNAISLMLRHSFGDWMLRKFLYALERALDLENTAILFSQDASAFHSGACLFSNREPVAFTSKLYAELAAAGPNAIMEAHSDAPGRRQAGIGFVDVTGEMSVLLVEFPDDRVLGALEIKTLRITASLLSMAAKLDGHDQEARRIAVLEERAAIARELHDSLAQSLSFMKIQLARLQSYQNSSNSESREQMKIIASELRHGLDNAYRELRELLATFRVQMDVRGLDFAIESAIEEFSQRSGLPISLDNRLAGAPLTVNEEFHVLHVVREALSNILHHARAQNVWITMAVRRNGAVTVTIDDDGIGYSPATEIKEASHHGQTIMKERAFSLGGTIDIAARQSGGTRVKLTFTPKKLQYQ